MTQSEILTTKQVAQEFGISEGTLRYWRHCDEGPASFRLGAKRVVYRRSAVEDWIFAQEAATTRGGVA
ncbi:helix-turn-helix domain protein [Rhodococcus sp. MTM3W5.2]|uniref:helix-turn-helix transcriptional regulator n=1 Tax=Rhodococcus sp. MTM3W5.2 TaxID=1805827 RepID=UPI000979748B|nr:helix-turn-helix domain-containing protein [Rhodococcus sp. MTM3W5.2]AQA20750.1 helix-turn-helix domain protein [Rhodococcus sp. MTM3W5.2]